MYKEVFQVAFTWGLGWVSGEDREKGLAAVAEITGHEH